MPEAPCPPCNSQNDSWVVHTHTFLNSNGKQMACNLSSSSFRCSSTEKSHSAMWLVSGTSSSGERHLSTPKLLSVVVSCASTTRSIQAVVPDSSCPVSESLVQDRLGVKHAYSPGTSGAQGRSGYLRLCLEKLTSWAPCESLEGKGACCCA